MVGQMSCTLGSNHHPPERATIAAPRWIELCFQTAGLWQLRSQGEMGLPQHVDWVRIWAVSEKIDRDIYAIVTPQGDGSFDAEIVDASGAVYLQMSGYRTVPFPIEAETVKRLQASMSLETVAA